jgi:hypothetical protein
MPRKPGPASPTNIEVDKTTLGRILRSRRLVVPGFQREYSWHHSRVRKLFSDFQAAMTKGQDSYFLGTVVFQSTNPPSVIDGQQRLATTCIFLAAVRDAYLKLGASDDAASITNDFLFTYDRDVKESLPRLLLNIDDREYIKNRVLVEPGQRPPTTERKEVHSHRMIDQAFACSCEWVKKIADRGMTPARKVEELNVWVDFIERKAVVVAITPPSLSQAYQMFITLNDRAQRTTQADLIKSHLFQEVSEGETHNTHLTEASTKWATARKMADIGVRSQEDPILSYLHYLCVIRTGPVTLDGLFDVIEGKIIGRNQALHFLDALSAYAKPYRAAIGDHPQFWDDKGHQLSRCVDHCVKDMGVRFPIPLFLAIGIKFSDKEAKIALRAIESWCARLVITGAQRSGTAERQFGAIAHRIHKGEIKTAEHLIREAESTVVPTDSRFQETFRAKTLPRERQARYFLLELEAQVRADDGDAFATSVDEPERLNLEHVLPKSSTWATNYAKFTTDERNASISKIGNLVLLKRDANRAIKDSPFSVKLPVLSSSSIKTTETVAAFAKDGDWTPAAIDARQVWLSELALKRWPLFAGKKSNGKRRHRRRN